MEHLITIIACSAGLTITSLTMRELYLWFRNLLPKTVQCWFCMHNTEVPYSLSNKWHCPNCEQYNGFTKDGDYNEPIQQQYYENFTVSMLGRNKNAWVRGKSLCRDCNRNQELKIQQLASFVPINENNYDAEVNHFRAQIEKAYKLCSSCEMILNLVLSKERKEYCVPRRIVTSIDQGRRGVSWLYFNIIASFLLITLGFLQTKGSAMIKMELKPYVIPILKVKAPSIHSIIMSGSSHFHELTIAVASYVLLIGALLSLVSYWRVMRHPILLLYNSLMWMVFCGFLMYRDERAQWVPFCEMFLGLFSCVLSFLNLKYIYLDARAYQQKQQTILQPRAQRTFNHVSKCQPASVSTSTPRSTPPQHISYVDSIVHSPRSNTPQKVCCMHDIGLEPAIRGLNLGPAAPQREQEDNRRMWTNSTLLPNSNDWSLYSASTTDPTIGTRITSAPLPQPVYGLDQTHVYSANLSYASNNSRSISPASTSASHCPSKITNNTISFPLRRRIHTSSIVSPSRLVLGTKPSEVDSLCGQYDCTNESPVATHFSSLSINQRSTTGSLSSPINDIIYCNELACFPCSHSCHAK